MNEALIVKGSTILVTGVNSFIANHIADQLLIDEFNVRGTVRSTSKGEGLQKHFDATYGEGRFESVVVQDITEPNAFDEAIKGMAGICHVATAASLTTNAEKAIAPTVAGAINIFHAASQEPSIKSIVYTSDSFAVLLPEPNKRVTITTSDYNEYAAQAAHDPMELMKARAKAWDPSVAAEFVVWAAAKVAAEKAVWQFVADCQPAFQVSSVIPNINFGAPVGDLSLTSTGKCITDLLSNMPDPTLYFPAQYFVNVRDCAKLHIAALLDPGQGGKRIFACAAPFNWNDILDILRRLRPDGPIREDFKDLGEDLTVLPNLAAEELLREWYDHGWTDLKETVRQNIEGL